MAGACDFLPPFSFWAAIISCLLRSASSSAFFFSRASASLFSVSSGLPSFLVSYAQHLRVPSSFQEPQLPSFLFLLCCHHFLSLTLSIFQCLLLFKSLSFPLFFFSCSILISFLLACFSFSLLSSSSSFALSSLQEWMYSFSWSLSSPFLALSSAEAMMCDWS